MTEFPDPATIANDSVMITVRRRLERILSERGGLERRVLVALSGGPDSTALLLALSAVCSDEPPMTLCAVHVNHGLRGAESDADEEFCRTLCLQLDVPYQSFRLSSTAGSEDSWRQARYRILLEAAQQLRASCVVTGHTQDDQSETMLFRFFRGTGTAGLAGIAEARILDDGAGIWLIRPMLDLSKQDCLSALDRLGVAACTDSSNLTTDYARNYIRQELVPVIERRFPGFSGRMEQLRTMIDADEELFESLVDEAEEGCLLASGLWSKAAFGILPLSLQRRLVARQLRALAIEVSFERVGLILELCRRESGAVSLDEDYEIRCRGDYLAWLPRGSQGSAAESDMEEMARLLADSGCQLDVPGVTRLDAAGWQVTVREWPGGQSPDRFPSARALEALADLTRVELPLELRLRRPGDVIRPFGMDRPVRLKHYLHTHKSGSSASLESPVSPPGRRPVLVIADREEVLWVPGVGLSEKIRVREVPSHKLEVFDLRQAQRRQDV